MAKVAHKEIKLQFIVLILKDHLLDYCAPCGPEHNKAGHKEKLTVTIKHD